MTIERRRLTPTTPAQAQLPLDVPPIRRRLPDVISESNPGGENVLVQQRIAQRQDAMSGLTSIVIPVHARGVVFHKEDEEIAMGAISQVTLRVPKTVAELWAKVNKNSDAFSRKELGDALQRFLEEDVGLTEWEGRYPPQCSGFYEVKQKSARDGAAVRWWYGPVAGDAHNWVWHDPSASKSSAEARGKLKGIDCATFAQSHCWRGLKRNYQLGYGFELRYPALPYKFVMTGQAVPGSAVFDGEKLVLPRRRRDL